MTTPAPKRGLVADEPTGRLRCGRQARPEGLCGRSIVRTSFSHAEDYRFCPPSRGSRSNLTASCSIASRASWTTIASTALCGSGRRRQRRPQPRAEATPCGSTRPAEPHPTGRQRVCGKAQSRLIDFDSKAKPAVGDADCCGALGCRVGEGLMSVTVDGRTRVLCEDCAREFLGGADE